MFSCDVTSSSLPRCDVHIDVRPLVIDSRHIDEHVVANDIYGAVGNENEMMMGVLM